MADCFDSQHDKIVDGLLKLLKSDREEVRECTICALIELCKSKDVTCDELLREVWSCIEEKGTSSMLVAACLDLLCTASKKCKEIKWQKSKLDRLYEICGTICWKKIALLYSIVIDKDEIDDFIKNICRKLENFRYLNLLKNMLKYFSVQFDLVPELLDLLHCCEDEETHATIWQILEILSVKDVKNSSALMEACELELEAQGEEDCNSMRHVIFKVLGNLIHTSPQRVIEICKAEFEEGHVDCLITLHSPAYDPSCHDMKFLLNIVSVDVLELLTAKKIIFPLQQLVEYSGKLKDNRKKLAMLNYLSKTGMKLDSFEPFLRNCLVEKELFNGILMCADCFENPSCDLVELCLGKCPPGNATAIKIIEETFNLMNNKQKSQTISYLLDSIFTAERSVLSCIQHIHLETAQQAMLCDFIVEKCMGNLISFVPSHHFRDRNVRSLLKTIYDDWNLSAMLHLIEFYSADEKNRISERILELTDGVNAIESARFLYAASGNHSETIKFLFKNVSSLNEAQVAWSIFENYPMFPGDLPEIAALSMRTDKEALVQLQAMMQNDSIDHYFAMKAIEKIAFSSEALLEDFLSLDSQTITFLLNSATCIPASMHSRITKYLVEGMGSSLECANMISPMIQQESQLFNDLFDDFLFLLLCKSWLNSHSITNRILDRLLSLSNLSLNSQKQLLLIIQKHRLVESFKDFLLSLLPVNVCNLMIL